MRRTLPIGLALAAGVLALPAAAQAAYTVGPGPDVLLTDTPHLTCDATCTLVQARYANEDTRVPSMSGTDRGVVVSYTVRGYGGKVRLRKLGVDGTNGSGATATAWEDLSSTDGAKQYVVSVPVRTGDALGIDVTGGSQVAYWEESSGFGADQLLGWEPALGNPQTRGADANIEGYLGYEAEVEPDADGDGLGDDTQDPCVNCHTPDPGPSDPGPGTPGPSDPAPSDPTPSDPYAEIRSGGPKVTIAGKASAAKRVVSVSATNPYAFALKGKLALKQGKKTIAKGKLTLAANAVRTVKLKVSAKVARTLSRRRKLKLTAAATMTGPVGKARTTSRKLMVAVAKPGKPGKGASGIDGVYKGSGGSAGWSLVIRNGVVENFNGRASLFCTKASKQVSETFAMIADDPDPVVAPDGSFAWEATKGYGFLKVKYKGTVRNGVVKGNLVLEDRPPVPGSDPVTGMPRIEFEYCFVGQDFELKRG